MFLPLNFFEYHMFAPEYCYIKYVSYRKLKDCLQSVVYTIIKESSHMLYWLHIFWCGKKAKQDLKAS